MKNIFLCLYFIFFAGISQCDVARRRTGYETVDSFEFGVISGSTEPILKTLLPIERPHIIVPVHDIGEVTFSTSGKIGPLEKNVRVPIVIPQCSQLTYVRVDVDNTVGPPYVTMDFDMRTVIIKYRTLQYSISSYVVTAKSVPNPNCR